MKNGQLDIDNDRCDIYMFSLSYLNTVLNTAIHNRAENIKLQDNNKGTCYQGQIQLCFTFNEKITFDQREKKKQAKYWFEQSNLSTVTPSSADGCCFKLCQIQEMFKHCYRHHVAVVTIKYMIGCYNFHFPSVRLSVLHPVIISRWKMKMVTVHK